MGRNRLRGGSVTAHPSQGGKVLTSRHPKGAEAPPPTSTTTNQTYEEFQKGGKRGSPDERVSGQEEECVTFFEPPDQDPGPCV